MVLAKERGAKRPLPLPFSVRPLLADAAARRKVLAHLQGVTIASGPRFPVLHNTDVQSHADAAGFVPRWLSSCTTPVRRGRDLRP